MTVGKFDFLKDAIEMAQLDGQTVEVSLTLDRNAAEAFAEMMRKAASK